MTILTGIWELAFITQYKEVHNYANQFIQNNTHVWFTNYDLSYVISDTACGYYVWQDDSLLSTWIEIDTVNTQGFVVDGRDIGTVVFKNADLKLYIDVKAEIRAKRRYKQLIDSGEKSIYRKILKDIKLRDKKDSLRKNSPLVVPRDAYIIYNNYEFKDTIKQIKKVLVNI